jgi:hypothetical protein
MFKPEKYVAHIELFENENRKINAVIIHYTNGSKETVTSNKLTIKTR